VGLLEELDRMDLADDVKERIRQEHQQEIQAEQSKRVIAEAQKRRGDVNAEIKELADIGFSESPGLLKFVRRVFLSDDGEPGIVLLSDADLELSGDEATDATGKEEMSTAETLRKFISLMPKKEVEGKLKVQLSDQALGAEAGEKPDDKSDDDASREEREKSAKGWSGQEVGTRTRKRYRGHARATAGGES
jgi:hypothetical protein